MTLRTNLQGIPEPTLRRLPVYHVYLKKIAEKGQEFISGTQIAEELNLVPVQIRKDLAFTGVIGKPKVGFEIQELLRKLEEVLGWHNISDAILVGVGNLGAALLGYSGFQACGLNVVTAFDSDPKKINTIINGKKIFAISKLPNLVKRLNIQIGILTVPEEACQAVAQLKVDSGIKAIWSFAPIKLNLPKQIIVQHENLAASLAVLSRQLASAQYAMPVSKSEE